MVADWRNRLGDCRVLRVKVYQLCQTVWRERMTTIPANSNAAGHLQRLFSLPSVYVLAALAACLMITIGCQVQDDELQDDELRPGQVHDPRNRGAGNPDNDKSGMLQNAQPEADAASVAATGGVLQSVAGGGGSDPDQQNRPAVKNEPSVAQLREAALQALGEGQDDLAFQFVRQAISMEPDNPQVVFLFAMVLADRHRYAEAIQMLQELSVREPTTRLPALGQTAEWMVESGRYDEAEQQFRSILQEVPDALMVHHRLGQLLLQTGRRTQAALHFDYLAQFGELDHEELRALLIRSRAFPGDDGMTRFDPLNNLAMCRQEIADGKAEEVVNVMDAAGEANSDAEVELLNRLRAQQGDFDQVQEWIETLDMKTAGPDAWFARGCLALKRASDDEAVACFCQTLLLDQTDADAYRMLSRALEEKGDVEKAKAVAARAGLVDETHRIGAKLVGDKAKDRDLIAQLVESLKNLKRPMEAFGWQTIGLVHAVEARAITETQAQSTFELIGRQRNQVVNSGNHRPDPAFVLCGLGPNVLDPVVEKPAP